MDFEQKKRLSKNQEKYHIENLAIAREFSKGLIIELKELVRSIVIFGSNTSNTLKKESDIDLMIVLDNVSVFVTEELREAYHIIVKKLNADIGKNKIHVMTMNLSELWDMSRKGDPVMINILRHGVALFDRDLIDPLQYLLEIGKIRPTREAVYNYMSRSQTLLEETEKHMQNSVLDLYYSLIDMVHATLMVYGITPPSPREMPEIFEKTFAKNPKLSVYSAEIKNIYVAAKEIEHHGKKFNAIQVDSMKKKISKIVLELKSIIEKELKTRDTFDL